MKAETISDQPYVVLSLWHGRGELGEIDPGLLLHTQVCGRLYKVHRVQANLQAQQMLTSPLNLLFSSFLTCSIFHFVSSSFCFFFSIECSSSFFGGSKCRDAQEDAVWLVLLPCLDPGA